MPQYLPFPLIPIGFTIIVMGTLRKRCKNFGCPNLHHNASGYCDECTARYRATHPREEKEKPTSSARKYYSSWQWRKFAKDFLKEHPVCEICGAPAEVCDHKDMTADMMVDAYGGFDYEPAHYQALCRSCNVRKGTREDKTMRETYKAELGLFNSTPGYSGKNGTPSSTALGSNDPTHGGD